jgi:cytochrome c oxidase subunit 2
MATERITTRVVAALAGLALAAQPVAAQASSSDAAISSLNERLLVVAIPITVLVEGVLIYTVYKYKDADEAKPTRENRRLEITWTIATAAVLLFVGISASITMADESVITPDDPEIGQDAEELNVTAYRYGWTFDYAKHNVSVDAAANALYLANGTETYFSLTTEDWLHSFHVPALGLKHDAVPGKIAYMKTTPTQTGTYQGYCAEYCGVGHSGMLFEVQVVEDHDALLDELASICDSRENKAWNDDTATCEWTGDTNDSNGSASVTPTPGGATAASVAPGASLGAASPTVAADPAR